MARQGIGTGTTPNDGTGDTLQSGAIKINENFSEVYNQVGNGTTLGVGVTFDDLYVMSGVTTSYGGFISGVSTDGQLGVATTPIHITLMGNVLSFTAVGIGSTFFTLSLS